MGRILFAEDDHDIREIFSTILEHAGHVVIQAADGGQALELADSLDGAVDLVVSDLIMPTVDGLELARRLRAQSGYAAVPYLLLTATGRDDPRVQAVRALDNTMVQFKPIPAAVLCTAVAGLIDRGRAA